MTTTQASAELQVLLEGIDLPASRRQLLDYAQRQDGGGRFISALERLPDREFATLDEVGEEFLSVQPSSAGGADLPRAESGEPPGGDAYVEPHPEPGAVRRSAPPEHPPAKSLEKQSETKEKQKHVQEEG